MNIKEANASVLSTFCTCEDRCKAAQSQSPSEEEKARRKFRGNRLREVGYKEHPKIAQ